jgi:competence protein ComEA
VVFHLGLPVARAYIRSMRQLIKEYFSFTKKERTAIITLLVLIVSVYLLPRFIRTRHNPPVAEEVQEIQEFKAAIQTEMATPHKEHAVDDKRPVRLFYFDPNSISESDWEQLGLREKIIKTIRNFLLKGGRFYKAADLKKIYGLKAEEFERISPYVKISSTSKEPATARYEQDVGKPSFKKEFKAKVSVVDINIAGIEAFVALPGIGNTLAGRIINFREKLGGFHAVEQVGETYGLPDSTFQKIRPFLSMETGAVRKININSADIETLKSHPYIRWQVANAVIKYREQHGKFKSLEEMQHIGAVTQEAYRKMEPYLTIDQ